MNSGLSSSSSGGSVNRYAVNADMSGSPGAWRPSCWALPRVTAWPPIPVRRPAMVTSCTRDWVPLSALLTGISVASAIPPTVMVDGFWTHASHLRLRDTPARGGSGRVIEPSNGGALQTHCRLRPVPCLACRSDNSASTRADFPSKGLQLPLDWRSHPPASRVAARACAYCSLHNAACPAAPRRRARLRRYSSGIRTFWGPKGWSRRRRLCVTTGRLTTDW